MLFWLTVAAIIGATLAAVLAPLWWGSGAAAGRASHDLQVLRDQLREIDADVARGILTADEASATRTEVSRRLLAAADAEAGETGPVPAPRTFTWPAMAASLAGAAAGAFALYAWLGSPGFPDQPRTERMAADAEAYATRPGQDEAEARIAAAGNVAEAPATPDHTDLVEKLIAVVAERPDDLQGQRLLARSLAAVGRYPEARKAQAQVIALLGAGASGAERVALAELMIRAANGYVSPEAEAAVAEGLRREPENPLGRYISGLALLQAGRPDLAHPIWSRLLDEGPADAPWIAAISGNIDAVAALAGLQQRAAPRGPVATPPGPGAADIEAAEAMDPAARAAMIGGMVDRLGARLAAEGGPPADWARLVQALRVLGRTEEAAAVAREAEGAFADDAPALALIAAAASTPAGSDPMSSGEPPPGTLP